MKKIIVLLVTMVMTFSMLWTTAFANENTISILANEVPQSVEDYAKEKLNSLLTPINEEPSSYGFSLEEPQNMLLGKGFNLYELVDGKLNETEIYYFPLLFKNSIRGILTVSSVDGEFYATLGKGFAEKLDKLNSNNEFVIARIDNSIYAIDNENELICLESYLSSNELDSELDILDEEDICKTIFNEVNNSEYNKINLLEINSEQELKGSDIRRVSGSKVFYKNLPVPIVRQVDSNGKLQPWCWAAVCASIINYKTGTSLTAQSVHDRFPKGDGSPSYNYNVYSTYKLYPSYKAPLNWTEACNEINANRPMHMYLYTQSGKRSGHSMALIGYSTDGYGGRAYTLIDPNDKWVTVTPAADKGAAVYYTLGGRNYYWENTHTFSY